MLRKERKDETKQRRTEVRAAGSNTRRKEGRKEPRKDEGRKEGR